MPSWVLSFPQAHRKPFGWSARQLAGELRHSPVHCDASYDGSFSILVQSALFLVEQHLEFFDFHNAYILSVQIYSFPTVYVPTSLILLWLL